MGFFPEDADILPPSDDRIFKLLLTSSEAKPALLNLLSALLGCKAVDATIHANEIPNEDTREKGERFDFNCKIDDGSQINIEFQAFPMKERADGLFRNIKGRTVYYAADLHASQPAKGLRRYDELAKTYQITFCTYTIFPTLQNYVNSFSFRHDEINEQLCDAIHIIFIELSKLEEITKKPVSEMTDLDKWSIFFQYAPDPMYRETVNKVIESEEVFQLAGNLLMSISKDEEERARFRSRRKFQTDIQSDLATSWDEGVAFGEMRGEKKRSSEIAQALLGMGLPFEQITAATGLSREEIERLRRVPYAN